MTNFKEADAMDITCISHSGFMIELERHVFLFDYYKGIIPEVNKEKDFYVFVSHKHSDHFTLKIFDLVFKYPKIHYILSKDTKMNQKYMDRRNIPIAARNKIIYVTGNQTYVEVGIVVETLTSTDAGVAFIVSCEGKSIYHSGDLNWWSFQGESPEQEKQMETAFKREMGKIKGRQFDVAFFPLDPRQGEHYYYGFDYFMRNTNTIQIYPMHCWDDYSIIRKLKNRKEACEYRDRIAVCAQWETD